MADIMDALINEYHTLYEFIKMHLVNNIEYAAKSKRLRELYVIVEKELIRRYLAEQLKKCDVEADAVEDDVGYCGFDCGYSCSICAGAGAGTFDLADEI